MAARARLLLLCSALVIGLAVPVALPANAKPARKPNLTVASVKAPAKVAAGGKVTVRTKLRNNGTAKAKRTTTSYRLSKDRKAGSDRTLRPTLRTPALRPRKAWTGRVTLTVPVAVAPGSYHLIACADAARKVREKREADNCRASARILVTARATSHELIDADVRAGRISAEQGLVYKVYSDFRDPRLPARYRGRADVLAHGALADAAQEWPTLSRAAQQTLRPFLIPPFYPGSHWTPASADVARSDGAGTTADEPLLGAPWCSGSDVIRGPAFRSWDHEDTAGGKIRIWWLASHPDDAVLAGEMAAILTRVLPELESLMGRSFKSDGGGLCDGGSDALDIAIVDATTATTYADGPCGQAGQSAHMVWPRTSPAEWAGIAPYLAHEVMHALQYATPMNGSCADYRWMMEMTAQWVQDYVTDPAYGVGLAPDDTEHLAAPYFLDRPKVSLDSETPPKHDYGAYLFTQWAVRKSSPHFVRDVWNNAATLKPKPALDAALPGDGFESTWDEFALSNWNRGPIRDYKDWDDMTLGAKPIGPEPVFAGHPRNPSVHVDHLAAQYLELDIDEGVTELEVENDLAGDDHAKLRAVITYDDGNHDIVDLSDQQKTVLCIDDGARRATSVVLIFSNAHQTDAKDFEPTLRGSANCGCPNAPAGLSAPAAVEAEAAATCTGNLTFSYRDEVTRYNPDGSVESESVTEGSGTLGIGFLPPEPDAPSIWPMDPASTYSVQRTRHGEVHRPCAETSDTTHQGQGTLGDLATSAWDEPDSDRVLVGALVGMQTTYERVHTNCGGTFPESGTEVLVVPSCPVINDGSGWYWEFEPTAPGSDTYTFACTDTVQYEDGLGEHDATVSISGTITLP